jgi:hypothetical protein
MNISVIASTLRVFAKDFGLDCNWGMLLIKH